MQGDSERIPGRRNRTGGVRKWLRRVPRTATVVLCCAGLFLTGFLLGLHQGRRSRSVPSLTGAGQAVATYSVAVGGADSAQGAARTDLTGEHGGETGSPVSSEEGSGSPASSEEETGAPSAEEPATGASLPTPTPRGLLSALNWPVEGRIIGEPGWRRDDFGEWAYFPGVDIRADPGSPVRAALPGVILTISTDAVLGTVVVVGHEAQLETTYGRLASTAGAPGERVLQGEVIGNSGQDALYFKIALDEEALDPRDYLARAGQ